MQKLLPSLILIAMLFLCAPLQCQEKNAAFSKVQLSPLAKTENAGDAFSRTKSWRKAASCYADLLKAEPRNAQYQYKYGGALAMQAQQSGLITALSMAGDIENAFLAAARLDPRHINARWALVEFYLALPGIFGGSEKKALYYACELQDISRVDGFLAKGRICEYFKRFPEAEKWYLKAFETGRSKVCCDKLSALYIKMKMPQKAASIIEDYQMRKTANASAANFQTN